MNLNLIGKQNFSVEAKKIAGCLNSATFQIVRDVNTDANIDVIQNAKAFTYNNVTREIYMKEILVKEKNLVLIIFYE